MICGNCFNIMKTRWSFSKQQNTKQLFCKCGADTKPKKMVDKDFEEILGEEMRKVGFDNGKEKGKNYRSDRGVAGVRQRTRRR